MWLNDANAMLDAEVIYFSTDYVFSGDAREPILEDAKPQPLNVYGKSKWCGELHAENYERFHTIRTSGVFGPRPDGTERNFFRAIFDKLHQTDGPIEVVDDQYTCVTYAPHLAAMVLELLPELPKIAHVTSAGADSWFGWARQLALAAGFDPARIVPVPTDPSSPVRRPAYSVLGSRHEHINRLIGQFPATKGIAEYVLLLKGRL
jgi:dTDP-4-dehydrorhamnose reductase